MYVSFCKEHIIFKLLSNITKLLSCKEINIQDMHVLLSSVSCTKFPMSAVFFLPYTTENIQKPTKITNKT